MSFSSTGNSGDPDNTSPGAQIQLSDQPEQNKVYNESSQDKFNTGEEATEDQSTQGKRNQDTYIMEPLQQLVEDIRKVFQTKESWAKDLQEKRKQQMNKLVMSDAHMDPLSCTEQYMQHRTLLSDYSEDILTFNEVLKNMSAYMDKLQSLLHTVVKQISATGEQASLSPEESNTSENIDERKVQEILQKMKSVVSPECFQRATKLMENTTPTELLNLCVLLVDELPHIHKAKNQPSSSSRSWMRPTVKVFPFVAGQTFGAHDAILKLVTNRNLIMKQTQITNQQESDIIMIFCPTTSRSGSDVEAVLSRKEVSSSGKPVILVLMHHTRDVEYSGGRKWTVNHPNVLLEVHVLFHETLPGLLQCDRNKQAAKEIQHVLNKYSKYG